MIAVVVSRADEASEHIGEHLLALRDWTETTDETRTDAEGGGTVYRTEGFELREFDALHLELDDVAGVFDDPSLVAFVSRHSGETGPLLTAHATGNFGPDAYGGRPRSLARAPPNALRRAVRALDEHAPDGYDVAMECTHHGPTAVGAPSMFVELGSGEDQWRDPAGARAVARAVLDLQGVAPDGDRHLVAFGGNHYAPRPNRILRETDWAVGHVAADWALDDLGDPAAGREVIEQAFARSRAERAVVDGRYPDLAGVVEDLGYRVVSETWVRETSGVPVELVADVEAALSPVDEGLRFGARARDHDGAFAVVDLPADLLAEAHGIDAEAARAAVADVALAFETRENGNRAAERAAVADPADRDAVVAALADEVLTRKYDAVEHREGDVVARREGFDPEKAAARGVPEGPKFGRLAGGEPVTVDGETVRPGEVTTERVRRFDG